MRTRVNVSALALAAELDVMPDAIIDAATELALRAEEWGKGHRSVFRTLIHAGDADLAPDAADIIRAYYRPVFPEQVRDQAAGPEWSGAVPGSSTVRAEVSLVEGGTVGERSRGPWEGTFLNPSTGASVTWGDTEPFAEAAEAAFDEFLPRL